MTRTNVSSPTGRPGTQVQSAIDFAGTPSIKKDSYPPELSGSTARYSGTLESSRSLATWSLGGPEALHQLVVVPEEEEGGRP